VNEAFETLTGHDYLSIFNKTLSFLVGPLTNSIDFEAIQNYTSMQPSSSLQNQINNSEDTKSYFEKSFFIYCKNGSVILVQIIVIINISKFRGPPLNVNSLTHDFLSDIAVEAEEIENEKKHNKNSNSSNNNNKKNKDNKEETVINNTNNNAKQYRGVKDFFNKQHEFNYHLLRFGYLCEGFSPKDEFSNNKKK
jgi:hypothetical protein